MFRLSSTELIIVFAIFVLLFGVGRISKIGRELGGGIRAFRKGFSEEEDMNEEAEA